MPDRSGAAGTSRNCIPLALCANTMASALGVGMAATLEALRGRRSGLRACGFETADLDTWIGRVDDTLLPPIGGRLAHFDCRNNRLARLALDCDEFRARVGAARLRFGAGRIALLLGTSTSGILSTEEAFRRVDPDTGALPPGFNFAGTHDMGSLAAYVGHELGLGGPTLVCSTACSSSAKVFASAERYLAAGLCDAAVVGGVDSLCLTTLYGFHSLELVSSEPCRPADESRDGLSLGEAAGFSLLVRPEDDDRGDVLLRGYGENSDAYHMSSPHPQGAGAGLAMETALKRAGMTADAIDYVNLHGTATPSNDLAEAIAVHGVFGTRVPCSSTKGWTGHTLGAAGITEALISLLCIRHGFTPGSLNTRRVDPALPCRIAVRNSDSEPRHVLTNSFGFGGTNCSLVLGARDA